MSYIIPTSTSYLEKLANRNNLRYYRLKIDGVDYSTKIEKFSLTGGQSKDYAQWSVNLINKDDSLAEGDLANLEVTIDVKSGTSNYYRIFTGFTDEQGCKKTIGRITENKIKLSMYDRQKSKGIKRKPNSAVLAGCKISDPSNTSSSIFHYLANLTGVSTYDTNLIDHTVTITDVGSNTAWQELQKLAEQYKADMYYRYDGALRFRSPFETGYTTPTSEWTFVADGTVEQTLNQSLVYGKVSKSKQAITCNYCTTEFDEYIALDQQIIYQNIENYDEYLKRISIELDANEYIAGGATDYVSCSYKNPDTGEVYNYASNIVTPTIGATGTGCDIEFTGGDLILVSFNGSTNATKQNADSSEIILLNNSSSPCKITKWTLRGKPYSIDSAVSVYDIDPDIVNDYDYVENSLEGKYVASAGQAQISCTRTVNEGKDQRAVYKFTSDFCPILQKGMIATYSEKDHTDATIKIISYTHKCKGTQFTTTVEAIEYGEVSEEGNSRKSVTSQIDVTAKINKDNNLAIAEIEKTAVSSTVPNASLMPDKPIVWNASFKDSENFLYINISDNNTIYLTDIYSDEGTKLNTVSSAYPVYIGSDQIAYINQADESKIYVKSINNTDTGTALTTVSAWNLAYQSNYIYFTDDDQILKRVDFDGNIETVLDEKINLISADENDLLITKYDEDGLYKYNGTDFDQILSGVIVQDLAPYTDDYFLYVTDENKVYQKPYASTDLSYTGDLIYEGISNVDGAGNIVLLTSAIDGYVYTLVDKTGLDIPLIPESYNDEFTGTINIGSRLITNIPTVKISKISKGDTISGTGITEGTEVLELGADYIIINTPATLTSDDLTFYNNGSRLLIDANRMIVKGSVQADQLSSSAICSKAKSADGNYISDINLDTGKQTYRDNSGKIKLELDPATGTFRYLGDIDIESDDEDRQINIGSKGILAKDVNGNIVHDLANDGLSSVFEYAGHFYPTITSTYFAMIAETTSKSGIVNIDLSDLQTELNVDLLSYKYISVLMLTMFTGNNTTPTYGLHTYNTSIKDLPVYNDSTTKKLVSNNNLSFYEPDSSSSNQHRSYHTDDAKYKIHNNGGVPYISLYEVLTVQPTSTGTVNINMYCNGLYT